MQSRYDNAVAMLQSGLLEEAIREFAELATEASDDNWKATYLLGEARCYSNLGRLDDADRVLEEFTKLAPIDDIKLEAAFVVACIFAQRGEHKNAANLYGSMLQEYAQLLATPGNRGFYEDICFRRAIELASADEIREAVQLFEEATNFSSLKIEDRQELHSWLGICYEELGEHDRAIQAFLHAIGFNRINKIEAETRYRIARLYFSQGGFAQAKIHLEAILCDYKAVLETIPLEYVYQQLSRACHYLGEKQNARHYAMMGQNLKKKQ